MGSLGLARTLVQVWCLVFGLGSWTLVQVTLRPWMGEIFWAVIWPPVACSVGVGDGVVVNGG